MTEFLSYSDAVSKKTILYTFQENLDAFIPMRKQRDILRCAEIGYLLKQLQREVSLDVGILPP